MNSAIPALLYTTEAWLQDAAMVKSAYGMVFGEEAAFPNVKDIFKENDRAVANGVLRIVDPEMRVEMEAKAVQKLFQQNSSVNSVPAFVAFMERFRKGLNHYRTPDRHRSVLQSQEPERRNHYRAAPLARRPAESTPQDRRRSDSPDYHKHKTVAVPMLTTIVALTRTTVHDTGQIPTRDMAVSVPSLQPPI